MWRPLSEQFTNFEAWSFPKSPKPMSSSNKSKCIVLIKGNFAKISNTQVNQLIETPTPRKGKLPEDVLMGRGQRDIDR